MGTTHALKAIRNRVAGLPAVQGLIRRAARAGVVPRVVHRWLPPLGLHPLSTPQGHEFLYVAHLDDMLARSLVWDNLAEWERTTVEVVSRHATGAGLVVDVGAYTGIYSLIACADGAREVIAVEPNAGILPFLRHNIAANGWAQRIHVIPKGASSGPGTARLSVPFDTTAASVCLDGEVGQPIELCTLDEVLAGRRVDLIKIDAEGHERAVCQGAADTLRRCRPPLVIEVLGDEPFAALWDLLGPLGYGRCQHIGPHGLIEARGAVETPRFANYLWT